MLEATPHRTKFNSHLLPDETHILQGIAGYTDWKFPEQALYQINIPTLHYPRASWEALIGIHPTTTYRPIIRTFPNAEEGTELAGYYTRTDPPVPFPEEYIFTIENTNIVFFIFFHQ